MAPSRERTYRQPLQSSAKILEATVKKKKQTHLRVILGPLCKERLERVVGGDQEARKVDQKLAGDVEEDQEKVDADQAEDSVDLGNGALALKVVEDGVFGELGMRVYN